MQERGPIPPWQMGNARLRVVKTASQGHTASSGVNPDLPACAMHSFSLRSSLSIWGGLGPVSAGVPSYREARCASDKENKVCRQTAEFKSQICCSFPCSLIQVTRPLCASVFSSLKWVYKITPHPQIKYPPCRVIDFKI